MNVDQYNFSSKLKTSLIVMMVIGFVSLLANWMFFDDAAHTRFWSNMLLNSTFFMGIAFTSLFFMSGMIVGLGGWMTAFKRLWEAYSMFLPVSLILMLIIALGVYFGWHDLYHWNDADSVAHDPILKHKSAFLNKGFYLFGTIITIGMWSYFALRIRKLSLLEDAEGDKSWWHHRKIRISAAILLPLAGYSSSIMIWQWVMSIDAHWYSTLYAWYATISWFDSALALTILMLFFLRSKGYFKSVTVEHMHDLGKFLFAFSIFWTYLWFSQFMLIWYSNNGEETGYFKLRMNEYTVLHYGILLINFIAPFFILIRNDTKRKQGSLTLAAGLVFIGHWLDYFLMIKPGVAHTAHELAGSHGGDHGGHAVDAVAHGHADATPFMDGFHFPGFIEFGILVGFLGLFLYVVFSSLAKAKTLPPNDPYLEETLHHHS